MRDAKTRAEKIMLAREGCKTRGTREHAKNKITYVRRHVEHKAYEARGT